jgi:hypothetical protein
MPVRRFMAEWQSGLPLGECFAFLDWLILTFLISRM